MNRDPLHESVVERLAKLTDGVLFEKCVCSLLRGDWPNLIPAPGGDDAGVDGNWSNADGRGIVCVTLQDDVIGNVTRNLNRHIASGATAKQVLVVTSRELSQARVRNIEKRVEELGFHLAHAPYTRDAIVEMLLGSSRWLQELLGISGKPPALSRRPRSCRKTLGVGLLGRDAELTRILHSEGDFLVVGQPGIGKTFLLHELANQGHGLFVTCSDEGAIANAIRDQSPTAIFVEDCHLSLEVVKFLKHYREEFGASYRIIGDCWPGRQNEVRNALGITPSASIELRPLGSDKIVDIAKACGIAGPSVFFHILVEQSMGYPGRTLTLIDACKSRRREDLEYVWTGESLADAVLASLSQSAEKNAAQILACIALGGEHGVTASFVTEILGVSISDVQLVVAQLSMGGVVLEVPSDRIAVVPRTLRPILVRDHFFNSAVNLPWRDRIRAGGIDFSCAIETIVHAHARGAKISSFELLTLVEQANSLSCWKSYAFSSPQHAVTVIERHPDRIALLARELIASNSSQTIPHLLRLAQGDDRSLTSASDHLLRIVQDWIHSGDPRTGEATVRRQLTLDVFRDWVEADGDLDLVLRLVPLFTSPRFESIEQDPAFRMNHVMRHGSVSLCDIEAIAELWKSILDLLVGRAITEWSSLIDAVRAWLFPCFGGSGAPDGYRRIRDESAAYLLPAITGMATSRPGVVSAIREIANDFPEVQINVEVDPLFRTMFPEREYTYDEEQFRQSLNAASAYGESLGDTVPIESIRRIQACWDESKVLRTRPTSYTCELCNAISQKTIHQIPWITAAWNSNVEPHILMPFLFRAVELREAQAEEYLRLCLLSDRYCRGAIELVLQSNGIPDNLRQLAIDSCRMVPEVVGTVIFRYSLSNDALIQLLTHDSRDVVQEAIEALWHCRNTKPLPESMKTDWRRAVVLHCTTLHHLPDILRSDFVLRLDWLRYRASASDSPYIPEEVFDAAVDGLEESLRLDLLDNLNPDGRYARQLIKTIVQDFPDALRRLVRRTDLRDYRLVPLQRVIDPAWVSIALVLLGEGISEADILRATRMGYQMEWAGVPQKFEKEIEDWGRVAELTSSGPLLRIAAKGIDSVRQEMYDWMEREKREQLL